ncbi:putative ubiquitin-conjugating enzyme family protein [Lyophyllum shimeji]|uniref:E2 ubiquitin-conjugating enzyme n=1 Tax=Lyophyllum shimeji TaxID=47721 RepID=A0A9P3UT42_LYOSH|nr:putative ubiquitin-conjugating enzyme family protein [Lyophyllum shimeji]
MSLSPAALRRLMRELTELKKSPPEGIRIQTSDEDMLDVTGIIQGPEGTPYAGGYFKVKFKFTEEFPAAPPKCWFATKIFHPNVSNTGEICVNTLKKDWKSTYGIEHILVTVKCLLIYPNPESALDEEAGKLLRENYSSYCDRAKLITSVHATPRTRPVEFDTPSAASSVPEASSSTSTPAKTPTPVLLTSTSTSSTCSSSTFTLPIVTRKSASPVPPSKIVSLDKEGLMSPNKERHTSPSPLSTADANVGGKAGPTVGMGMPTAPTVTGSKAVKRAATGGAATGAEKRKKALKRL